MYQEKFHLSNRVIEFSFRIGIFWATGQSTIYTNWLCQVWAVVWICRDEANVKTQELPRGNSMTCCVLTITYNSFLRILKNCLRYKSGLYLMQSVYEYMIGRNSYCQSKVDFMKGNVELRRGIVIYWSYSMFKSKYTQRLLYCTEAWLGHSLDFTELMVDFTKNSNFFLEISEFLEKFKLFFLHACNKWPKEATEVLSIVRHLCHFECKPIQESRPFFHQNWIFIGPSARRACRPAKWKESVICFYYWDTRGSAAM